MKTKTSPTQIQSPDYLEQACLEGLRPAGLKFAKARIKEFRSFGGNVPYGLIRKIAQTMTSY